MNVFKQAIRQVSLCITLGVIVLTTACSALPTLSLPAEEKEVPRQDRDHDIPALDYAQSPLEQDAPLMPPMDVITVELNAGVSQETLRSASVKCPKLDARLVSVIDAPDPLAMAQALQMKVNQMKIQVLLVLDGADASFLQDFGVEISKQSGDKVQAFVPIARLCDLANNERVLTLAPPNQAVIQQ